MDKFITKTVGYKCQICSLVILCDKALIQKHVRKHDLSYPQYMKKFYGENHKAYSQEVTYSNDIIGSLCQFQCRDCGDKFNNRGTLKTHQLRIHGSQFDRGEKMIKRVMHKCKLCARYLTCESGNLITHFKLMHGLSLKEYSKQTGCKIAKCIHHSILKFRSMLQTLPRSDAIGNFCVFECKQCNNSFKCKQNLEYHLRKYHSEEDFNVFSYLKHGFSYQCNFCSQIILCDKLLIKAHLKNVHGPVFLDQSVMPISKKKEHYATLYKSFMENVPTSTVIGKKPTTSVNDIPIQEFSSKIGNLCQFSCPTCDSKSFWSWRILMRHSKKHHQKVAIFKPSVVIEARYHSCLLCPTAVLSDRHFLSKHLQSRHKKVLMSEYERIYCKNGGEALPTF